MELPQRLVYTQPFAHIRSRCKAAGVVWGAFFALWFLGAFLLQSVELSAEREKSQSFHEHAAALVTDVEATAAGEGLQTDLDDLLDWLVDHGNCVVNDPGVTDWDLWGSLIFVLSLATSIGYGHFSVTTKLGQILAVVLSFVLLPLFVGCLKFSTDLVSASVKILPGYPKASGDGRIMDLAVRKAGIGTMWLGFFLGAWIFLVGAVGLTTIMKEERTLGEGLYFGWITLSTIGFGDFVFGMKETKGVGIGFILVGLPLFSAFLTSFVSFFGLVFRKTTAASHAAFGAGGAGLFPDELRREQLRKVSLLYTDNELALAAAAFSVVDVFNRKADGTLDFAELKTMLYLVGASEAIGLGDGGGGEGDPREEDCLVEHLLATADPLGVGRGSKGSSADANAGIVPGVWLLVLAPLFTVAGHRREVHKGIRACVLSWVAVGFFVMAGGWLLSLFEGAAEDERHALWKHLLKAHATNLTEEKEVRLSAMVAHLVGKGVCAIPECDEYESPEFEREKDLFRCTTYHRTWDFSGASFFCFTTISTIGFGSFTPKSTSARALTTALSLPGIVLFSAALGSLLELPALLAGFYHIYFRPPDDGRNRDTPSKEHRHHPHRRQAPKPGGGKFGGKRRARQKTPTYGLSPVALALGEGGGVNDVAAQVLLGLNLSPRVFRGSGETGGQRQLGPPGSKLSRGGGQHPKFFVRGADGTLHNHQDSSADSDSDGEWAFGSSGSGGASGDDGATPASEQQGGGSFLAIARGSSLSRSSQSKERNSPEDLPSEPLPAVAEKSAPEASETRYQPGTCASCGIDRRDAVWALLAVAALAAITFLYALVLEDHNGWGVGASAYFAWISCTTIGLGDYAPSNDAMHWSVVVLPVGLALVGRLIGTLDSLMSSGAASLSRPTPSTLAPSPQNNGTTTTTTVEEGGAGSDGYTSSGPPLGVVLSPTRAPAAAVTVPSSFPVRMETPPPHQRLLMAVHEALQAKRAREVSERTKEIALLVRGATDAKSPTFAELLNGKGPAARPKGSARGTSGRAVTEMVATTTESAPVVQPFATPAKVLTLPPLSPSEARQEKEEIEDVASLIAAAAEAADYVPAETKDGDDNLSSTEATATAPSVTFTESDDYEYKDDGLGEVPTMFGAGMGAVGGSVGSFASMGANMGANVGGAMGGAIGDLSLSRLSTENMLGGLPAFDSASLPKLAVPSFNFFSGAANSDSGSASPGTSI